MLPISVATRAKIKKNQKEWEAYKSKRKKQKPFASILEKFDALPHQKAFIEDYTSRNACLCAGYGAGKTLALLTKLIDLAQRNAGYTGALYAPTGELARDVLIPELDDLLERVGLKFSYRSSPNPTYKFHFAEGTTTVLVRSMENWKRIVGSNFAFACIDEIDTIKKETAAIAWKKIMGRMRAGNVRQIATTSTPEGFQFLYEWFEKDVKEAAKKGKEIKGRRLIRAKTTDNPYLPEDFAQDLLDNYPPQLIKAYLNGEFVNLTSGTVYSNFDRDLNKCDDQIKTNEPLHIGMDFNVMHMAAVVNIMRDGRPRAIAEIVELEDTPAMIRTIQQRYQGHPVTIYPDASGGNTSSKGAGQSDLTLLRAAGFKIKVDGRNPLVKDRVATVQAALLNAQGERRYRVNIDKCPRLTEAFEQQVWNANGEPDKTQGHDHVCFTGDTKVLTSVGLIPIKSMSSHGFVHTVDGSIVPYHSCQRIKTFAPIVRVTLSSGRIVECTPSHEFLTDSGWVQAKNLAGRSLCSQSRLLTNRSNCLTESNISEERKGIDILSGCMQKNILISNICIEPSGYAITALSLMDFTSIILMGTQQIMKYSILSYFLLRNISKAIIMSEKDWIQGGTENQPLKVWKKRENLQMYGMAPQKDGYGIKNMLCKSLKTIESIYLKLNAVFVSQYFSLVRFFSTIATKNVETKESLGTGEPQEWIMKKGTAQSAIRCLFATNTQKLKLAQDNVVEVCEVENKDVYCLTVPSHGCFLIEGGYVVSNCDACGYTLMHLMPIRKPSTQQSSAPAIW